MTNTTDNYWEVDGVSLQTYAWNISSIAGKLALPTMRGEDAVVPHQEGDEFTEKVAGPRILPLSMWIRGSNADGSVPANKAQAFDDNWRALVKLLWIPGRQFDLTKRFVDAGDPKTATARGQMNGGIEPTMIGRYGARFVVNIKLTDPWFYDDEEVTTVITPSQTVVIGGDVTTRHIRFEFNGGRDQPAVRNDTLDIDLQYNGALTGGESAELDVRRSRAWVIDSAHPLGYVANDKIVRSGDVKWFALQPGNNLITDESASGSGTMNMISRAAYL